MTKIKKYRVRIELIGTYEGKNEDEIRDKINDNLKNIKGHEEYLDINVIKDGDE